MSQPVVHEIKGYIQTIYMVQEGDCLLLLDGCCRPDVEVVKEFIEDKLSLSMKNLEYVISTHPHPDHAGGAMFFKRLYGTKILAPKGINHWYAGVNGFFTYWMDILLTYMVAARKGSGFKKILFPRTLEIDQTLKDGDLIPGFESWQVIEAHGHTAHDISIYHKEAQLAYIADNFVGSKRNVFRPYPVFLPREYQRTLQKYIDLGIEEFLIAHYGRITVPTDRIQELITTTPMRRRSHVNSLHSIFFKIFSSFFKPRRK